MCTIFTIHPLPHVHPRSPSKILYTGSADRGRLRITGVYGINNKTCGFLHHRGTLESSESTAKIWLNSAWYRISEIHPLERSSCEGMHRHMPTRSRPLKALIALVSSLAPLPVVTMSPAATVPWRILVPHRHVSTTVRRAPTEVRVWAPT
jgi:hypothetical protein